MMLALFLALSTLATAFAADMPKDLTLEEALKITGCRPMVISAQGPRTESFGQSQITVEVGAERFVRSDMGAPDGKLTVLRQGKKICEIQTSLLGGVHTVFGKVLLLRFTPDSNHYWHIYDYSGDCKPLGRVPPAIALKFAEDISKKLPSCKDKK